MYRVASGALIAPFHTVPKLLPIFRLPVRSAQGRNKQQLYFQDRQIPESSIEELLPRDHYASPVRDKKGRAARELFCASELHWLRQSL